MLDMTRKPLFPQLGTKKTVFPGKSRIVPEHVKGEPFVIY